METSYLPSNNIIVVATMVALWHSSSMLLPNWLLSAFLVASPLAAVANEVKVQAEEAAAVANEAPPTDVFPPSRCPWQR